MLFTGDLSKPFPALQGSSSGSLGRLCLYRCGKIIVQDAHAGEQGKGWCSSLAEPLRRTSAAGPGRHSRWESRRV